MREKKLQIFVSSTFSDLITERQAAVEAILSSRHIPAGMELFSAGDESQMTVIKRWIDESDIYLLILGGRYGSVEPKSNKSYTQLEYEYAIETKKPLFAVVQNQKSIDLKVKEFGIEIIEQENPKELKAFREEVLKNLVKFWDDKKDIKIAIHETLAEFSYRKELVGWIRGDNSVNTGILAEEIARLTKENSELRTRLDDNKGNSFIGAISYIDLENLLINETVDEDIDDEVTSDKNLLEGFMIYAPVLSTGFYGANRRQSKFLKKLAKYKLVEDIGDASTFIFILSEDGHAFYLHKLVGKY